VIDKEASLEGYFTNDFVQVLTSVGLRLPVLGGRTVNKEAGLSFTVVRIGAAQLSCGSRRAEAARPLRRSTECDMDRG